MLQVDEAQACLAQAQKYWQSQQWQQTIQACAQALAINQKLPQAHKLMGDALQRTDKAKEAIGYYQEAIKLQPNFVEVYANLGTLYVKQKQYQQGINYYQQTLKINPNFTAVKKHLHKAIALLNQEDFQNTQSHSKDDSTLERYLEQGQNLEDQGELKAALTQYLTAAKLKPQRVETYREIIRLCESLGLWSEAAKYCRLILKLTNAQLNQSALTPQPQALNSSKELPQLVATNNPNTSKVTGVAEADKAALQVVSHHSNQYLVQGNRLVKQGKYKSAMQCYLAGLARQQDPQLYFALGNIYQGIQKLEQASLCYQKTVQLDPNHSQAYHELGEIFSQQQQWSKAVKVYRQAIKLKPNFSWSYNNLGYALIQLNQWTEAIPAYRQAIKLKPNFSWSYYNLAEAYSKLGQWVEAIAVYQQAIKLQVDLPQVQQKLGDALYKRSEQDRRCALAYFLEAINQDPNNPEVYHQALAINKRNLALYLKLGDLLVESGQLEQAFVTYQMALTLQPRNFEVLKRIEQYQGFASSAINPNITARIFPPLNYAAFTAELEKILPHSEHPTVSIIIPVYNQLDYTLRCLKAIAINHNQSIPVEIILVNDCSTDQTEAILSPLTAIKLINQPTNQGFIHACNQGAAIAQGEYLYFLNNDTEIKPQCIASLVQVFAEDPAVGAVGSKLIYPNGLLQEAGGIVWQDASGWNYGRQKNPHAPKYNYLRPVDYCSGASLMVKKEVFESLKGFETDFAPAYYEDTDLCFAIREQLGMKVMYQPKSEVIHYEGITAGTSIASGTKQYQAVNALKFQQKWQGDLNQNNYLPNVGEANVALAARKYLGQQTILVIDSYMPSYDRESGSRRLFALLKIFKALNYHVIFAADNGMPEEPYVSVLQNLQIEVLYTEVGYGKSIEAQIEAYLSFIDLAWICRPELNQKYATLIRQKPEIKLIYDTVDLHYLRLKRAWGIDPHHCHEEKWLAMQTQELAMAHQADLTITVTPIEQQLLKTQGVEKVAVIPNIHLAHQGQIPGFAHRKGILFIGSYNHLPNVDAVIWLCQEIMPLVWQINPELKVTLLGNNPSAEVLALASDLITVTGYVEDVTPYFLSHKLSVSPLRYGAGMKGKIGQSLEYGLPVVSTKIGTEGMNLIAEEQILEADHALNFAQQILRLNGDPQLWQLISSNAQKALAHYSPTAVQLKVAEVFQQITTIEDKPKKSD